MRRRLTVQGECDALSAIMPDPTQVSAMFGRIARRYDTANRLLSGGADVWWRRRLVAAACHTSPRAVLDLATGSGDVALALARALPAPAQVTGLDFCAPMLVEAEQKRAAARGLRASVVFRAGDALALPVADASADVITIAFGLRNLADRARGLSEMQRALRPGGRLLVLEFSQPKAWFRPVYYFYLRRVLPVLAHLVTGDRAAYDYLCGSIAEFPSHTELSEEIRRAGFARVEASRMTFGIVALHEAVK
jgi:demethylmenaquinone methyltransferase/2-methoxy-6-polyprenyl-1,4-benzoquinol methylase